MNMTDEALEFLTVESQKAYAAGDVLSYTAKDGQDYMFSVSAVFGSDDPDLNDGFHALSVTLLNEQGEETDQTALIIRSGNGYLETLASMDEDACGWSLFIKHKDEILGWYNDQKDAGNEVSLTGANLGGALSQMFAGFIHQETGDTLKSVVTFSSPGIEKSVTYDGSTYDFSGTIAETVHHYIDSGDVLMQTGSYYVEGDVYLYGCNYYLDQAGENGEVIRLKDYLSLPSSEIKYLLADGYSSQPAAVLLTEMKTSEMTGSWNPLSINVDETPDGIENTNNAVITVGSNTYLFNKAYAEIVLTMGTSAGGGSLDINYASKYVSRSKWEEMRATEEGRQDFLGTALMYDYTADVNVGVSGSFSQGGKDYAVLTLTGKTEQGKEFLYSFADGCFLEITDVVNDGNWQGVAGAQTYSVQFEQLGSASGTPGLVAGEPQQKTYSTDVSNELIEAIKKCTVGEHEIGEIIEYTSQAGLTYRLKYTELYGSDDPETNDGFHAAGVVLLDVDGVTETDEHFLFFRGTSSYPDAIADFYNDAPALPIFAAHTQDVLDWYEKYEGEKITFAGASLGCMLAQYFAGWLVNDQGKEQLTRLVGFLSPAIVKEATYEDTTYHFITDESVAESVDFYRHEGDILAGFGQYYQKGTIHSYGSNAQLDQADGVKLHEYINVAHSSGTYLTGGSDALTWLGDFDTDYFSKDANYSDLAVKVDAVPEGLENTNVEAVTCGDQIYLFNCEYADVALTVVAQDLANYDETLKDFLADASSFTCRNYWEECRGEQKQEALARLLSYDNTSDIEVSTGRGVTLDGQDYVQLANTGSDWTGDFFYNFTTKMFEAGYDLVSASNIGEVGGVTFAAGDDATSIALAGEVITVEAQKIAGYYVTGFVSDQVELSGNQFTMLDTEVTVKALYADAVSEYNQSGKSDIVQISADNQVYVTGDSGTGYAQSAALYDLSGWTALETRRDFTGDGLADIQIAGSDGCQNHTLVAILRNDFEDSNIQLNYQTIRAYDNELWEYVGAADINGDGKDETLLVQTEMGSDNGLHHICAWTTDETGAYQQDQDVWVGSYHIGWSIAGTADVDGNGTDNIILRRADGQICYWSETGTNDLVRVWYAAGSDFLTAADFSGNAKDDILWSNAAGDFFVWNEIDDELVDTCIGNVADLDGNWSFAGAGDYNGDGKDEILWCDAAAGKMAFGGATADTFQNLTTIA